MALEAMDSVASYSSMSTSTYGFLDGGEEEYKPYIACYQDESVYVAPDQFIDDWLTIEQAKLAVRYTGITIGNEIYRWTKGAEAWKRGIAERPASALVPHTELAPVDVSPFELIGVELLNNYDVYHVRASQYEGRHTTSFWIGVDDLLIHRFRDRHHNSPTGYAFNPAGEIIETPADDEIEPLTLDEIPRFDWLIEFHSFNGDFNIQPPPEDEIADSE